MFSYLKNLLWSRRPARVGRPARRKPQGRRRPGLEMLEERQLLSVSYSTFPTPNDPGHMTLVATASSPADVFQLDAPAASATPTVYGTDTMFNLVMYKGNMANIDHIIFEGVGGNIYVHNKATLNVHGIGESIPHPHGYDLDLYGDHGTLQEATYDLTLNQVPEIIAHGDAQGTAELFGSNSLQNTFLGTPNSSSMSNAKTSDAALGFGYVIGFAGDSYGYAYGTPKDTAYLEGSISSQCHFTLSAQATGGISSYAALLLAGTTTSGTRSYSSGFHYATVLAGSPVLGMSSDIVDFRGSKTLPSTFTSHGITNVATDSVMAANNDAYSFEAFGCRYAAAVAGTKFDQAYLYGSTTSPNKLTNLPLDALHRSDVYLTSNVHRDEVVGFMQVVAYAGTASDHAVLAGHQHKDFMILGHKIDQAKGASPGGPSLTYEIDAVDFSTDGDIQV